MAKIVEIKTYKIRKDRSCSCCGRMFYPGASMTRLTISGNSGRRKGYDTFHCPLCEAYRIANPQRMRNYGWGMFLEFGDDYNRFRTEFFRVKE